MCRPRRKPAADVGSPLGEGDVGLPRPVADANEQPDDPRPDRTRRPSSDELCVIEAQSARPAPGRNEGDGLRFVDQPVRRREIRYKTTDRARQGASSVAFEIEGEASGRLGVHDETPGSAEAVDVRAAVAV